MARLGRYVWHFQRHWPFLIMRKLPPMERVHWWMPDEIRGKKGRKK